jgi:hypothetical protein
VRLFDVKPLIHPESVFEPLADIEVFKSKLTVMSDTVAWGLFGEKDPRRCLDLDPFTIYEGVVVADPLGSAD